MVPRITKHNSVDGERWGVTDLSQLDLLNIHQALAKFQAKTLADFYATKSLEELYFLGGQLTRVSKLMFMIEDEKGIM
jgi:hypothetical protein